MRLTAQPGQFAVVFTLAFCAALALLWATYEPARVNVRWRDGTSSSDRAAVEAELRLTQPRQEDQRTWSYALSDASTDNIRRLVRDPRVEDTHHIDRDRFELARDVAPPPFIGPRWFAAWAALIGAVAVAAVEWARRRLRLRFVLQRALATAAAPVLAIRRVSWMSDALPDSSSAAADVPANSTRIWSTVVTMASAPLVIVLCVALWRSPFPITEIVALLEDVVDQPAASLLSPDTTYYRPLFELALSAFWHAPAPVETKLAGIKLMTIVPVVVMLVAFVWHLGPRTAVEAAAAALAVAVLIGSPGFRDNLEVGLSYTIVGMPLALITWIVLNRERRPWHTPLVVVLTVIAIGFKEQGLVLVSVVLVGWWTAAPGASRGMAVAATVIAICYVALRISATATWEVFEQDVGLGFTELDRFTAAARFGEFPYWMYAYNGASTIANVLFAEPTRGMFRIVHAAIYDNLQPWHVIHLCSSAALTALIAWWGTRRVSEALRAGWSPESRLFLVTIVVLLASGALSFNYSRDRLGGMAVVFYAAAAFFAVRAAAALISKAPGAVFVAAALVLALLSAAWQTRAVATIEWARAHASGGTRQWLVLVAERRVTFGRRAAYIRIMESMVPQGTASNAARPTRLPEWAHQVLGQ